VARMVKQQAPQPCRGGNCGHSPEEHENGSGRCRGEHSDYYGVWRCLCPYYTQEPV